MEIDCGETHKKMAIDEDKPAIEGMHKKLPGNLSNNVAKRQAGRESIIIFVCC